MVTVSGEFEIGCEATHQVVIVGKERTPVLVLDRFLKSTSRLITGASQVLFEKGLSTGYPGIRAGLPSAYVDAVKRALIPLLRQTYHVPPDYIEKVHHQLFSLVCTPESELAVLQRIPHVDTQRSYYFAVLHYLNAGCYGGTGFYRHVPTQYERVTVRRHPHYVTAVKHFIEKTGVPDRCYYRGADNHYELIGQVDYRPNRLVVYPGNLLHSGMIDPAKDAPEFWSSHGKYIH